MNEWISTNAGDLLRCFALIMIACVVVTIILGEYQIWKGRDK